MRLAWAGIGLLALPVATLVVVSGSAGRALATTCAGLPATIVGTRNAELLPGTPGPDVILAEGGDDVVNGGGGDDVICGGDGNDVLFGEAGNDQILGQDGSDFLLGGLGDDRLNGGGGIGPDAIDMATYDLSATPVNVDLSAGRATGEGTDTLVGVDSAWGSKLDDVLIGDSGINYLSPGEGSDTVDGGSGDDFVLFDAAVTASLATGAATGEGRDTLVDLEGLIGSKQNDVLTGDDAANYLAGSAGNDVLRGESGDDRVYGDIGDDRVEAGPGEDVAGGGPGADTVDGGPGVLDTVSYLSAPGRVSVDLAAGRATGEGTDAVSGVESVSGSHFADTLVGDAAPNFIVGNQGGDRIASGPGPDFLGGGSGANSLLGGTGTDYCLEGAGERRCEIFGLPGRVPGRPGKPPRTARTPSGTAEAPPSWRALAGVADLHAAERSELPRLASTLEHEADALAGAPLAPRPAPDPFESPLAILLRAAAQTLGDRVEYRGEPTCLVSSRPFQTSIAPPVRVDPILRDGGTEHAWWRGTLYRRTPGHAPVKVRDTPWRTAQIAGGAVPTGIPSWLDAHRQRFTGRMVTTVPAGRYSWAAEVHWDRTTKVLRGWVEPHIAETSSIAPKKFCDFG